MTSAINPQFMSVNDFATNKGFAKCAVYRMIKDPTFPCIKIGNKFYIDTLKFEEQWLPHKQQTTLKGV
jgi:hypothetical protein